LSYAAAQAAAIVELLRVNFAHLQAKDDILATLQREGAVAAIQLIKRTILLCVYMPTANSSKATYLAAKTLIEGGACPAGAGQGIGGRLLVCDLQPALAAFIVAYAGKQDDFRARLHSPAILAALQCQQQDWPAELAQIHDPEQLLQKIMLLFSEKKLYDKATHAAMTAAGGLPAYVFPPDLLTLLRQAPPTWWQIADDLAKQNLQPRLRTLCPWLLAELYDGLPLFTANLSEAAAGYSTWAGDTSLGYENSLGGILKSDVRRMLVCYEKAKLCGLGPMPSLRYVNQLTPSAELRPLAANGTYSQTDEADLMPYGQLDTIITAMIVDKRTPWQTYQLLKDVCDEQQQPLFKHDEERVMRIEQVCKLYQASQFKRTGGGNHPFLGKNLDPHVSLATPLHAYFFANGCVEMKLRYLADKAGVPFNLKHYIQVICNQALRQFVTTATLSVIQAQMAVHFPGNHP
jgi:NH3-dependent NAD+ synthetase